MVKRDYRTWFFSGCPKNSRMVFLLREVCYPNQRDLKLQILSWSWLFLCKWVVSPKSNSINESSIYFYATWNRPYVVELRRRRWHPTPVLLPGKSHGWRSLVGCSPWGTHSSILSWQISWTEEPGGLQSIGSQRVRHDWSNLACTHFSPQKISRDISEFSM